MKIEEIQRMREEGVSMRSIAKHYNCRANKLREFMYSHGVKPSNRVKLSWTREMEKELLKLKAEGKTLMELSKHFGPSTAAIATKLKSFGIGKPKKIVKFSEEGMQDIQSMLARGEKRKDIAALYDITYKTLLLKLKEANVTSSNYIITPEFFKEINTEASAYFLGFLYADGYNNVKGTQLKFKLKNEDSYIIKRLAEYITKGRTLPPLTAEENGTSSMQFYSKELSKNLETLGCGQAKAFTLTFPSEDIVPEEFLSHFIRGYFDGDGSIYYAMRGKDNNIQYTNINFTGNIQFITALHKYLQNKLKVSNTKIQPLQERGTVQVRYTSYDDIEALRDYMYLNSSEELRLKRKFNMFPTELEVIALKTKGKMMKRLDNPMVVVEIDTKNSFFFKNQYEAEEKLGPSHSTFLQALRHGYIVSKKYKVISASI